MERTGNRGRRIESERRGRTREWRERGTGEADRVREERENKRMERTGNRGRRIESERRGRTREWRERGTGGGG